MWSQRDILLLTTSVGAFIDRKILVILFDGRTLIGTLRSFDQFCSIVLEDVLERIVVGNLYYDMPLGIMYVRGENAVLIGEVDLNLPDEPPFLINASLPEIKAAKKAEKDSSELKRNLGKWMTEFLNDDY